MAITTAMCSTLKSELMSGSHNFGVGGNTFKFLLLSSTETGTYGAATTNVGTPGTGTPSASNVGTDEVSGAGYTTGGYTLTNSGVTLSGTTAYTTFGNASWTSATFSTNGGVLYDSTAGGKTCGCFDFGGTQSVNSGTFTVLMPSATTTTAILRLQ